MYLSFICEPHRWCDISYTVCNSPNTENIGSITLISDEAAEPDMNFIDPIFSVLVQLYTV
jgi:hypothetical protein